MDNHNMEYFEFLKADILCLLHDYGEMPKEEINSMLGSNENDVEDALFELVIERKVAEVGECNYATTDEVTVKRFKKALPRIF